MQGLTPTEIRFINAFRDLYAENGYSPSYQELVDAGAAKSKSVISRVVDQLESKGIIKRHKFHARGIILIPLCECPTCGQALPKTSETELEPIQEHSAK